MGIAALEDGLFANLLIFDDFWDIFPPLPPPRMRTSLRFAGAKRQVGHPRYSGNMMQNKRRRLHVCVASDDLYLEVRKYVERDCREEEYDDIEDGDSDDEDE